MKREGEAEIGEGGRRKRRQCGRRDAKIMGEERAWKGELEV